MVMIHIEGTLTYGKYDDGVEFKELNQSVASAIEYQLAEVSNGKFGYSQLDENYQNRKNRDYMFDDGVESSIFIPKVSFRAYFSDEKCSLEEAEHNQILMSIGALDILQHWSGYSEWTILGYDVTNFKLVSDDGGEHDLEQIFRTYAGKYAHIVIEIIE